MAYKDGGAMHVDALLGINDLPTEAVHLIFGFLAPRELCRTSAVCRAWRDMNKDASANRVWEGHFAKRWKTPANHCTEAWQMRYGQKMHNARAFSRKGLADVLYGHTASVSAIGLLPACNLLATGSSDCTVRIWDLEAGLPCGCSRNLKHTVRALSLDDSMLACGGAQDGAIRLWRSRAGSGASKFDLCLPTKLIGHSGPVVSLASSSRLLFSASWDCSVRMWNKTTLKREARLAFPDWVNSAKPCGSNLLVTAGQTFYACDTETGKIVAKYLHSALHGLGNMHWEAGRSTSPLQVEGSQDGRLVFLAGSDGAVIALDPRTVKQQVAVLWDQNSAVKGLSFEDPWLAAATYCGSVLLMDVEAILRGGRKYDGMPHPSKKKPSTPHRATRQRFSSPRGATLCVDIADSYLACGSGDPVVRTWAFKQSESEHWKSPPMGRQARGSRRLRNRFAYSSSSDEERTDGGSQTHTDSDSPRAAMRPLSHSLPAQLDNTYQISGSGNGCSSALEERSPHNSTSSMQTGMGMREQFTGCQGASLPNASAQRTAGIEQVQPISACINSVAMVSEKPGQSGLEPSGPPRTVLTRQRAALVPLPLRCRAEARRLLRSSLDI